MPTMQDTMTTRHAARRGRATRLAVSGFASLALLAPSGTATAATATLKPPKATQAAQDTGTDRISRTFEVGPTGRLELWNLAGDIVVNAVSGSTVTLTATKHVRPRGNQSTAEALADVEIEIEQRGDLVEVHTRHARGRGRRRAWVDYDVSAPAGTRVSLHSVSGSLEASGVEGELRAETVSGRVQIRSAGSLRTAKSVSGDVRIESARTADDAEIGSVSGDIVVADLEADRLEVQTVSGEIDLRRVTSRRVEVSTVSGNLDYEGPLVANGRYELQSHSGDLVLHLAGEVGFELVAETFSGDVDTDVPLTIRGGTRDRDDRGRGRHGRSLRGTYGDGSARIDVTTFSGDLEIRQR